MPHAEKILVRGVNWLGDAVMTTPALQRLREARPHAHITLLTHEKLAALWQGHPSLNAVLTFSDGESLFSVAKRLRAERFELACVFPNSPRSALEVRLAGIPEQVGYARNWRRWLLTKPVPPRGEAVRMHKRSESEVKQRMEKDLPRETFSASAHHVHDYLQIVAALGGNPAPLPPLIAVSENEVASVRQRFGLDDAEVVFALNPGAEYGAAKRWPAARFVEAAVSLQRQTGCTWVVLGGKADIPAARRISEEISAQLGETSVRNVAGQTSLRELCALLKTSQIAVTNDTGPMHVAAALGTPVVVPFGSTSPELTGPSFTNASPHAVLLGTAPCAPCFLRECPIDFRCMKSIAVSDVVAAAMRVWHARGS